MKSRGLLQPEKKDKLKLEVLQHDLLPTIQAISRSVGVKSTLPVLGNILLASHEGKLKIAATNLEIGVIKMISAKILADLIASLPASLITIETNGDLVKITANKFSAEINGIPANEFPVIPTSTENSVSFKRQILKDYSRIMFAASGDGGRPVLTG